MAHKSRTKSPQNTKIVKKVAHPTGNNVQQVQGEKVTMPINAETESVSFIAWNFHASASQ